MAIKSRSKKILLMISLAVVSAVLGVVNLFSGHGGSKANQAQAQCWTSPISGSCSACGCASGGSSGSSGSGCSCGAGSCSCGCSSCGCW